MESTENYGLPRDALSALERLSGEIDDTTREGGVTDGKESIHDEIDHEAGVRVVDYRDHTVEIVTHYEISIAGEPWEQPVYVMDDGTVHYPGLPQYNVASAVDLMKGVIDAAYAAPDVVLDAAKGI